MCCCAGGSDGAFVRLPVCNECLRVLRWLSQVLRGCTLRNTGWVVGLVVFSGIDTKVCMWLACRAYV